jgi:hypothetical protein
MNFVKLIHVCSTPRVSEERPIKFDEKNDNSR